jgi:hypothetical protein
MPSNGPEPDQGGDLSTASLVESYVAMRDRVKQMEQAHKQALAPFKEAMALIEDVCLIRLQREGGDHIGTPAGTVYQKIDTRVSIADWEMLLGFIQTNQAWHFLTKDVSKEAVVNFLEEFAELPPGVSISRTTAVGIRRARNTRTSTKDTANHV